MLDPVIFSIFGIEIYWYGLFYVIGFLFAYFFILKFSSEFGFSKEKIEDIIFWTMLFGILGGRLGHILFYDPIYYFSNLSEIIRVDKGGMSIHGGLIGAIVTLYYFSWKDKLDFLKLTDLFVIPTALALAFGRLANFINQELVGNVTSSSLGVVFPLYDDKVRWPSTIFESIKNMITFQILIYLFFFKKLNSGFLTAWFLILYNFGRFFIDFLRVHELSLGIISMGQFLSLIFGFAGLILLYYLCKKK